MQNTITDKLQKVAEFRHEKPGQVIAEAVEIGLGKILICSGETKSLFSYIPDVSLRNVNESIVSDKILINLKQMLSCVPSASMAP